MKQRHQQHLPELYNATPPFTTESTSYNISWCCKPNAAFTSPQKILIKKQNLNFTPNQNKLLATFVANKRGLTRYQQDVQTKKFVKALEELYKQGLREKNIT